MARRRTQYGTDPSTKITALRVLVVIIVGVIAARLFFLQVIRHGFYTEVAAKEHYGYTELPARRGEIFIQDYASGETVRVATNVTLDTLYADPTLIKDPKLVADRIVPLIFNLETEREKDELRVQQEIKRAQTPEDREKIKELTDEELYTQFYQNILQNISQTVRPQIFFDPLPEETLNEISKQGLVGVEVIDGQLFAYPPKISNIEYTASTLSNYMDITPNRLEQILAGKNRYVILAKKIDPEVSAEIRQIMEEDENKNFFGLGLQEEYYRFYPEAELAANALGFVTPAGLGQYGIESKYNTQLQGKKGVFQTQRDGSIYGRQITVGDSVIEPAQDGDDIVLTIDRSMQMTIESMLARAVQDYRADSGQVVVMDPNTGRIMAMAHYPSFDPNNFSAALDTEEIPLTPEEVQSLVPIEGEDDSFWFYRNVAAHDRYKVMREKVEDDNGNEFYIYKRFKNWIGLEAYQNKIVASPYEPGSIFKTITMASAIDDKDVTPQTSFSDPGILHVDEYEITNVSNKCTGYVTMVDVLGNSCNTGVGWVSQKMGRNLFHSYILKFGFGERTGIEFDNEHPGKVSHFNQWADSELVTHAFGQGLTTTPLQMAAAYAVIANGGQLMQPHIVDKIIEKNGRVTETQVTPIHKVITEETATQVTAMLTSAVENGVAGNAQVDNHYVAAKTGTSQTYKYGKPLTGAGTTIASVAGFGPVDNPKFVLIVKFDRPRSSEWAGETAAFLYSDISAYLYDYLGIPPDKA